MLSYSKKNSFFLFILNKNIIFVFYSFYDKEKKYSDYLISKEKKKE